jgi:hypothetical protein
MARKASSGKAKQNNPGRDVSSRVYALEVFLTEGPAPEEFAEENPVVMRTIEIRGDQTLETLHHTIFDAFDRDDEHLYEFQFGEGPHDPDGPRYTVQSGYLVGDAAFGDEEAGDVATTTIDSLALTPDSVFGYWFDFGDDWYHQIRVHAIKAVEPGIKYPRVTVAVGASPPQYPDYDDEDYDDEDDEDEDEDEGEDEEEAPPLN